MSSLRRIGTIFFGLMLAYAVWAVPVQGVVEPRSGTILGPYQIELTTTDGQVISGKLAQQYIPLEMDYGELRIQPNQVKRVEVNQLDPAANDQEFMLCDFTMQDKQRLHGRWLAESLFYESADGIVSSLPLREVATVRFLKASQESWMAILFGLLTLTFLEIVLGVDNIIFLVILAGKLPEHQRPRARRIGLIVALATRLLLLFTLSLLMGLTKPLLMLPELPMLSTSEARGISVRDLILIVGGLFLVGKSTYEMHEKVQAAKAKPTDQATLGRASFLNVIIMIALIDIVFSLDSVITAVGMVEQLWVMVTAMIIAMLVMLLFAGPIAHFVEENPTIKILALSFLILIGVLLLAEGFGQHVNKGYVYFAMIFSVVVEVLNLKLRTPPASELPAEAVPASVKVDAAN